MKGLPTLLSHRLPPPQMHPKHRSRAATLLIRLPFFLALCAGTLLAEPSAKTSEDDWNISALGQSLELPGYDLFSVKIENESDRDQSVLGLIHLASRSDSGNPQKTAKCQFFASVPAGKSVEIQVPCEWESEKGGHADMLRLEIEKTYPFLLEGGAD